MKTSPDSSKKGLIQLGINKQSRLKQGVGGVSIFVVEISMTIFIILKFKISTRHKQISAIADVMSMARLAVDH